MIIQVIRTPADLGETLEASICRINRWLLGDPAGTANEVIDDLFSGREGLDAHEDAEAVASYLDAAARPLHRLPQLGLQLVVVLTRGRYLVSASRRRARITLAPVDIADYLVAPDPCYFRLADAEFGAPIHTLGADCLPGHELIVNGTAERNAGGKSFSIWTERAEVTRDFELAVPWCSTCLEADQAAEEAGRIG
jgi:hypothetical protein